MGNMNQMQVQCSRRRMLRGLGVTMALPWMESLRVWGDVRSDKKESSQAPTRMGILFSLHRAIAVLSITRKSFAKT